MSITAVAPLMSAEAPAALVELEAPAALVELPIEVLTHICRRLSTYDILHVAATCARFRHGGQATVELPSESPVVTAMLDHPSCRRETLPSLRAARCNESWVSYLVRRQQQRCRLDEPPIAATTGLSAYVDKAGRLLTCGRSTLLDHGISLHGHDSAPDILAMQTRLFQQPRQCPNPSG
jgi:hypothetical protein